MIKELRIENLRRHKSTHIELGEEERTIVVTGANGAGKSTIIEAIVFALVGESRLGRSGLDRLVRRGAEIEGLEVEMAFTIDNSEWRIIRRREGKTSSAVLSVNGQPLVEGVKAVTEAVENLLGMDAQGIKLAVVAQQKELDALTKMGGAARARAIGRLLRLDALERAKDEARLSWRSSVTALDAIPPTGDLQDLARQLTDAQNIWSAASRAEQQCRDTIATLEAELALTTDVDASWRAMREKQAANAAVISTLKRNLAKVEAERDAISLPELITGVFDLRSIEEQNRKIDASIARAEAEADLASQREMIGRERSRVESRLSEIERETTSSVLVAELDETRLLLEANAARDEAVAKSAEMEQLREALGQARAGLEALERRRVSLTELGAVCDTCGQEIDETHTHGQMTSVEERIATQTVAIEKIIEAGKQARTCRDEALLLDKTRTEQAAAAAQALERSSRLEGERGELLRRLEAYALHMERVDGDKVDLEGLYKERGESTLALSRAKRAAEVRAERDALFLRQTELGLAASETKEQLNTLLAEADVLDSDKALVASFEARASQVDAHRGELVMLGELAGASARSLEAVNVTRAHLKHANELAGARRKHQEAGMYANGAYRLLADVETKIGEQVRPMIEASITQVLAAMSEGRFSAVRVTADYEVQVMDDGAYRSVTELSGGEADLVALATRLGIADVVCSRIGGVGFLILDEVFGSQDGPRRESILAALRSLRGTYGQVWCISHVGGLEETADRVITVEKDEDGISVVS